MCVFAHIRFCDIADQLVVDLQCLLKCDVLYLNESCVSELGLEKILSAVLSTHYTWSLLRSNFDFKEQIQGWKY